VSSPLAPIDADGNALAVGMQVKVNSVVSCVSGLPHEDQERLAQAVGTSMVVTEIDKYGFLWLSRDGESSYFCLKPDEVQVA
jgi:hypothetical protein